MNLDYNHNVRLTSNARLDSSLAFLVLSMVTLRGGIRLW